MEREPWDGNWCLVKELYLAQGGVGMGVGKGGAREERGRKKEKRTTATPN